MNYCARSTSMMSYLTFLAMLICSAETMADGLLSDTFDGRKSYSRSTMSCLVVNDFYAVHFTAIQESQRKGEDSPFVKYCQEIPTTGKTYLTIDLLDRDVRKMPVSLRVIEESVDEDGRIKEIKRVLTEVPAKVYRNGTADTGLTIGKPGHYALVASFGDDLITEDDRLRIPFTVGLPSGVKYSHLFGKFAVILVTGFFIVALGLIGYFTYRSYRPRNRRVLAGEDAGATKVG